MDIVRALDRIARACTGEMTFTICDEIKDAQERGFEDMWIISNGAEWRIHSADDIDVYGTVVRISDGTDTIAIPESSISRVEYH